MVQAAQQACIDMAADRQDGRPVLPGQQHKQELAAFSLGVPTNPLQASKMLQAWSASADPGESCPIRPCLCW